MRVQVIMGVGPEDTAAAVGALIDKPDAPHRLRRWIGKIGCGEGTERPSDTGLPPLGPGLLHFRGFQVHAGERLEIEHELERGLAGLALEREPLRAG